MVSQYPHAWSGRECESSTRSLSRPMRLDRRMMAIDEAAHQDRLETLVEAASGIAGQRCCRGK